MVSFASSPLSNQNIRAKYFHLAPKIVPAVSEQDDGGFFPAGFVHTTFGGICVREILSRVLEPDAGLELTEHVSRKLVHPIPSACSSEA